MTTSKAVRRRSTEKKAFTVSEANATLPLVRAITTDLVALAGDVAQRRRRLSTLASHAGEANIRDPYAEEVAQIEQDLAKDEVRLQEYAIELRDLGVEPADESEGFVDFPTVIDGRRAFLSWKLGESEILYWHEQAGGYRHRRGLAVLQGPAERLQ